MSEFSYGIHPLDWPKSGSFALRFKTEEEARSASEAMAREHKTNVLVFKIIGEHQAEVVWFGPDL